MKIAKAGNIHNFCHPNSLLTLQVGGGQTLESNKCRGCLLSESVDRDVTVSLLVSLVLVTVNIGLGEWNGTMLSV